jgi:hypothetical protein
MKHAPPLSPDNDRPAVMTLQRLQQLLDAYGADPKRWPEEERTAALALLACSMEARARQAETERLDALLNLAPVAQPSAELISRVLAAAPAQETRPKSARNRLVGVIRTGWRRQSKAERRSVKSEGARRIPAWLPLAIAASLAIALWSVLTPTPRQELSPELSSDAIAALGVYYTSTDALLQWPGLDLLDTLPSVGCTSSGLGCPELNVSPESQSQSQAIERHYV